MRKSRSTKAFLAASAALSLAQAGGVHAAGAHAGGGGAVHYTYVPVIVPAPRPAGPPPLDGKPGSVFVQCDGYPAHQTPAEVAGRLLAIMATAGLAGPGELADVRKRAHGDAGVAACTQALGEEKDTVRRLQLTMARAIHNLEAGHSQEAMADAKSLDDLAQPVAQEIAWRRQFRLSGMELQAYALAQQDRAIEAAAVAEAMSASEPWDVAALLHTHRFAVLTWDIDSAKSAYLDRYVRQFPSMLTIKALHLEHVGRFAEAGDCLVALIDSKAALAAGEPLTEPALRAKAALDYAMAGDMKRSDALAAATREGIEKDEASGKAAGELNIIAEASELLDFREIVAALAAGHAAEARILFKGHSHWTHPGAGVMAAMADRLRAGAPASELAGGLAKDGAAIRAEWEASQLKVMQTASNLEAGWWSSQRPWQGEDAWTSWSKLVWNTDKSRLVSPPSAKPGSKGEFIFMSNMGGFDGEPGAEALLMHAALRARAQGKSLMLMQTNRATTRSGWVLYGNSGDPGFSPLVTLDVKTVIDGLSARFPNPSVKP